MLAAVVRVVALGGWSLAVGLSLALGESRARIAASASLAVTPTLSRAVGHCLFAQRRRHQILERVGAGLQQGQGARLRHPVGPLVRRHEPGKRDIAEAHQHRAAQQAEQQAEDAVERRQFCSARRGARDRRRDDGEDDERDDEHDRGGARAKLSSFDRIFGLLFGLLRGAVLVCLGYIALAWFMPADKRPDWVTQARTLPLLEAGANTLEDLVPAALREKAVATARDKVGVTASDADAAMRALLSPKASATEAKAHRPAYNPNDRRDMNRLIQQQQGQ